MTFFSLIYRIFYDISHLIKSQLSLRRKIRVLLSFTKILFKYFFLNPIFKFKKEKTLGIEFTFFSYKSFLILFMEIFVKNEYFFKAKNSKPIILDCGANIGMATLYFKWLYKNATIYSFEPDKDTFNTLNKNIKKNNLKNINLFNYALSDKKEKIKFYINKVNPGVLSMSTNKNRLSKDEVIVKAVKLSQIVKEKIKDKPIDFLKVDIEGAEWKLFADISKTKIFDQVREGSIEYHHNIKGEKSQFGKFLEIIEKHKFQYQVMAESIKGNQKNYFQDLIIYLYKK